MTKHDIMKFHNPALAFSFLNSMTRPGVVLLGDDGKFWVVEGRDAGKLIEAGYERIK